MRPDTTAVHLFPLTSQRCMSHLYFEVTFLKNHT
uniref:Uncharacterized protein n=1 Tax=Anguilla anguilla TaxID=7936 RepID=A0A0E9XIK5_ANGAN